MVLMGLMEQYLVNNILEHLQGIRHLLHHLIHHHIHFLSLCYFMVTMLSFLPLVNTITISTTSIYYSIQTQCSLYYHMILLMVHFVIHSSVLPLVVISLQQAFTQIQVSLLLPLLHLLLISVPTLLA